MRVRSLGLAVLTGVMLSAPMIAVMYLADRWLGLSFPPFDTFDWVARELPGPLVTFGIDTMIGLLMFVGLSVKDFAKTAEQLMAVGGFFTAGLVATAVVYAVVQWRGPDLRRELGLLFGAVAGVPVALMTVNISQSSVNLALVFVWVLALFLAWGFAAVWVARRLVLSTSTVYDSEDGDRSVVVYGRRQFLIRMGAATAAVTVAGVGLGRMLAMSDQSRLEEELTAAEGNMPGSASMVDLPNEGDPVKPVLGTRPEYTAVRDHYKVFIRSEPTLIDGATWTLPIVGLVNAPTQLTLNHLMNNYDSRSQFVTLTCISNSVGGDLISTTYWTGVSLRGHSQGRPAKRGGPLPGHHLRRRLPRDGGARPDRVGPPDHAHVRLGRTPHPVRSRIPAENLDPRPLRHEAAQVDNRNRGGKRKRVQGRLLGGARLGRGGAHPHDFGR